MKKSDFGRSKKAIVGQTRHIKYVFVDVVRFSTDRSVEAQNDIVETLNRVCADAFQALIPKGEVIYIPTGDGICVAILDVRAEYDAHLTFGLALLAQLAIQNDQAVSSSNRETGYMRKFDVRVGISENIDNIVKDINGRRNVAGVGVTLAQRVMSLADGGQILLSDGAYQTLRVREKYMDGFTHFKAVEKHGKPLDVYQFTQTGNPGLNTEVPGAFRNRERIEDELDACLRENPSTAGQVRCMREATDRWQEEMLDRLHQLTHRLDEKQRGLLDKAQRAWAKYKKAELEFAGEFYSKMRGTMWRPIRAGLSYSLLKERGRALATYSDLVDEQCDPSPENDSAFPVSK